MLYQIILFSVCRMSSTAGQDSSYFYWRLFWGKFQLNVICWNHFTVLYWIWIQIYCHYLLSPVLYAEIGCNEWSNKWHTTIVQHWCMWSFDWSDLIVCYLSANKVFSSVTLKRWYRCLQVWEDRKVQGMVRPCLQWTKKDLQVQSHLRLLHSTTHTHYSFINSLKNVIVRVFSLKIKRDVHCLCHIVTKNGTWVSEKPSVAAQKFLHRSLDTDKHKHE